jgi:hypothetical protein
MEFHAGFSLAVSQNKFVFPENTTTMDAVLTVASEEHTGATATAPEAAEVIVIDCSSSMNNPPTKIGAARRATAAAIDALRDGVHFAVVQGTEQAKNIYPADGGLATATAETRTAAKEAVRKVPAIGATAIGTWLRHADQLLATRSGAVRHAILLTDGKNLPRYEEDLDDALAACAGRFVCDSRGIGDDYAPEDVRRIATTLRGTADAMIDDGDLVPEFAALMTAAMGKAVPDVRLHVRTMPFTRLRFVRQTFPTEIDLTPFFVAVDERTTAVSTGSWGAEEREFLVGLEVERNTRHPMDQDIQAAKVELSVVPAGGTAAIPAARARPVLVHWTDDVRLSSMTNPKVDHYTGHAELGARMLAGWAAYKVDDLALAAKEWGHAVRLAARFDHHTMLARLRRIVDIDGDPADGVVTVRKNLLPREFMSAILHSSVSTRSPDSRTANELDAAGADQECANCAYISPPSAKVCQKCKLPLASTT